MGDPYLALQVHPSAEPDVIRAAYRALARLHHPDNGGDERRMTELNEAWAVLGDPLLRSAFDIERHGPVAPQLTVAQVEQDARTGPGSDAPLRTIHDLSTTMDFGRYTGWSLQQLVDSDPDYLLWLVRTSIGRRLTGEVTALIGLRASRGSVAVAPRRAKRRFGGRA